MVKSLLKDLVFGSDFHFYDFHFTFNLDFENRVSNLPIWPGDVIYAELNRQ